MAVMIKLNMHFTNPFDFERPVKNPKLFAGRQKELDEIDYYLELMLGENPTYHNLSIIGERASGKTSFLNMIQYMAEKKEMLAVKISLNNEMSENEVFLFKEFFDGIITKGVKRGMFGGLSGKVYRVYRKAIDLLELGAEVPFLFGTAYVGAKKNNTNSISQHVILSDLEKLSAEAKTQGIRGMVILLDECDLLASNQTLLQKLRNVFSDIEGFALIFSGTEKMFPAMTETFSPLPRIFKRIDVKNFVNHNETKECIIKRLSDEEKKLINDGTIAEIHSLTNGNPYEIQLISHFMYKKFKENKSQSLVLTTSVLDSVINELDRLREGGHHNIANQIKRCDQTQLNILTSILEFPNTTLDQLSRFMVLSNLKSTEIKSMGEELSSNRFMIDNLINFVIKEEEKKLSFAGDQFDTLYLRYHLLSRGIKQLMIGSPLEPDLNIHNKLSEVLLKEIPSYRSYAAFDESFSNSVNQRGIKGQKFTFGGRFQSKPGSKPGEYSTLFTFSPSESQKDFHLGAPNSMRFRVNCNFIQTGFVTQFLFDNESDLKKTQEKLQELRPKLELLGFEIILKDEIQITLDGVNSTKKKNYQEAIKYYDEAIKLNPKYELVWANKGHTLFSMKNYKDALPCYQKWIELRPKLPMALESIGKCYIHLSRYDKAFECLDKAANLGPESWSVWDNRGRALYNLKRFEEAVSSFNKAIELKNDDYDAYLFRGNCLAQIGKEKDAIGDFDKVLSQQPNHFDAIYNKAAALFVLKNNEQALNTIEKLGKKINDDILSMQMASLILDRLNKLDEAIDYCNKIIEKDPKLTTGWYNRSCFRVKLGQVDEGIQDLKKAFELDKKTVLDYLKTEKDFDSIKNDRRFQELVSENK